MRQLRIPLPAPQRFRRRISREAHRGPGLDRLVREEERPREERGVALRHALVRGHATAPEAKPRGRVVGRYALDGPDDWREFGVIPILHLGGALDLDTAEAGV